MSSVIVSHVSNSVSAAKVEEFFAFCGSIKYVNQLSPESAGYNSFQIVFASEKALDTALLLNEAELDGSPIVVAEEKLPNYGDVPGEKPATTDNKVQSDAIKTGDSSYDDISQEEKPRLAILAQLLASGYKVSDDLIDRAIKLDKQKGISAKFKAFLGDLDSKYLHTQDPELTASKNINKAQGQLNSLSASISKLPYLQKLHHYYEKASATPYGSKIHDFYKQVAKEVQDVHAEATRLYNLKKAESQPEPAVAAGEVVDTSSVTKS